MTKLLDSGELRTSDPIVASCFLNRYVSSPRYVGDTVLLAVNALQVELQYAGEQSGWFLYPILVPAATVAKVTSYRTGNTYDNTAFIIINHLTMTESRFYRLVSWLRKHTQETIDESV